MTFTRSKFHAKKTAVDGITFDSKREAERYRELKALESAGEISDLQIQVPFVLQDSFELHGRTVRPIKYVADFVYCRAGERIVEDCKGYRTDVYRLKRKLMMKRYGVEILET